jgi:hypothetical protein
MKRLLIVLPILACLVCVVPTHAQTIVAKASGSSGAGGTVPTSSTLNIATGQLLHVTCYNYDSPGTITVTDTGNTNTFHASPDGQVATAGAYTEAFYAYNTVAEATDTITCHFSSGTATFVGVMAVQMSGMNTTSSVLDTHAMGASATVSVTSGAFTTSGSDIIIAGADWNTTGSVCTAGMNFTLENQNSSGQGCDEYWIASSGQSGTTASMTTTSSTATTIVVMAYKAANTGNCAACDLSSIIHIRRN